MTRGERLLALDTSGRKKNNKKQNVKNLWMSLSSSPAKIFLWVYLPSTISRPRFSHSKRKQSRSKVEQTMKKSEQWTSVRIPRRKISEFYFRSICFNLRVSQSKQKHHQVHCQYQTDGKKCQTVFARFNFRFFSFSNFYHVLSAKKNCFLIFYFHSKFRRHVVAHFLLCCQTKQTFFVCLLNFLSDNDSTDIKTGGTSSLPVWSFLGVCAEVLLEVT